MKAPSIVDLAEALDHSFTRELKESGCDFVRFGDRPWIAARSGEMFAYAALVGPGGHAEFRIGSQTPAGVILDRASDLADAIYMAARKAAEFPPFYVE